MNVKPSVSGVVAATGSEVINVSGEGELERSDSAAQIKSKVSTPIAGHRRMKASDAAMTMLMVPTILVAILSAVSAGDGSLR